MIERCPKCGEPAIKTGAGYFRCMNCNLVMSPVAYSFAKGLAARVNELKSALRNQYTPKEIIRHIKRWVGFGNPISNEGAKELLSRIAQLEREKRIAERARDCYRYMAADIMRISKLEGSMFPYTLDDNPTEYVSMTDWSREDMEAFSYAIAEAEELNQNEQR